MAKILYLDLFEYPSDAEAQQNWVTDVSGLALDLYEYATPAAAQAAYVSSDALLFISNADIDDEDMADITDWSVAGAGTGASTQETFDSKSCMKLTSGGTAGGYAGRYQDVGTFGTRTVFSLSVYCDAIGTIANYDFARFMAYNGTDRLNVVFTSEGLFVYNGDWNEVGTDIVVQDTWQEWTFDVNWTAKTADVYLNGVLQASGVDFTCADAMANGTTTFNQFGDTTINQISYIDWFKAGSDFAGSLQCYSEDTIIQQGTYSLKVVAVETDSLNDTLTKSGLSLDLSGISELKIDCYASRTGTNLQMQIHDSGGTTSTKDIAISSANTWETTTWDISAIEDVNKDNIDQIIIKIINADSANTFYVDNFRSEESLQCYSEDTIKVQGDYSLKVSAVQTGSLNKTLTKTLTDYLDYSVQDVIKFDIRASRTGTNIQLQIHDTGGTTSTHNINIASVNVWQTETWDISEITGTDRDTIDKVIVKVSEATVANTIYMDNLYSQVIVESSHVFIGG